MAKSKRHSQVIRVFLMTGFLAATVAIVALGFQEGVTAFQAFILHPLLILALGAASCLVNASFTRSRTEHDHGGMESRPEAHEDRREPPLQRAA